MRRGWIIWGFILLLGLPCYAVASEKPVTSKQVWILPVTGAIGPAIADHLIRAIEKAQTKAYLIMLTLDTPGGLDYSMREIIKAMLGSRVPIVAYVYPKGARAASAGTFLLYASPIAAMAPGTNVGAASPVSMGGTDAAQKNKSKTTLEKKVQNDAAAYIRSLAQLYGRNAVFAEQAVRNAASLTAHEALHQKVIQFVAKDLDALLEQLQGYRFKIHDTAYVLDTRDLKRVAMMPDWRTKFLAVITDPSVAYMLLLAGMYGLFFEFTNPGMVLPGVVGAIALLMALYAFQMLPVNYAGLALILVGIGFMGAEVFMPSFGSLGVGGVIAFVIGSILLLDTEDPAYQIAGSVIFAMALVNAVVIFVIMGMALRARQRPCVLGKELLVGKIGLAIENIGITGQVKIQGELWLAESDAPILKGRGIVVVSVQGLKLKVSEKI